MDIIQPWQLYLILQADAISSTIGSVATIMAIVATIFSVVLVAGTCVYGASCGEAGIKPSTLWGFKWRLLSFYTAVLAVQVLAALVPSTKTAAIMFGVPAVVNNPTFQHETGEVYQLLKKALSDTVNKPEPPQEKKE